MSETGPRPRPRPQPGPEAAAPTPAPSAPAAPATAAPATSESAAPATPKPAAPAASHRSRSARRRAEQRADRNGRQRRLRRVMLAALAVAVVAGGASVVVALFGGDSGSGARAGGTGTGSATGKGGGAALSDPDRVTAFLAATTADVGAVTTYDYRRLDDALSAGLSVTTGGYRTAFQKALSGSVAAAARTNQVVHDFEVLDLGIGAMNSDGTQAKVLVFGRQLASDRTHRQPQATLLTLRATMVRQGDRYLISDLQQDADPGTPSGTSGLARAVEAGRAEVVNALTYTRANFDADLRRAIAGAVDPVRSELADEAKVTRPAMTKGGYDLTGVVVASAVKSADGNTVSLMVAAESSKVGGSGTQVTAIRYEVTVNLVGGAWRVSQIEALPNQ